MAYLGRTREFFFIMDDQNRSAELDRLGIHVMRFTNEQVLNYLKQVLSEIRKYVQTDAKHISPSP